MDVVVSNFAWINKKDYVKSFSIDKLNELRRHLTIRPKKTHRLQEDPEPVLLYKEDDENIGLPRSFFMERKRLEYSIKLDLSSGIDIDVKFEGELKYDQANAVAAVMDNRAKGGLGSIVQASPGWGKTVTALAIWSAMKKNCLVVVHKQFLIDQWVKRIKDFTPSARIGIIKGDKCQYGKDYDITIATIQTLSKRIESYPKEFFSSFGLLQYDETHRVSAPTWGVVAPMFNSLYRLGISATPRRKDGADNVFFYHIGEISYVSKVKRVTPSLRRIHTPFTISRTSRFDPNRAGKEIQLRFLCKSPERNRQIIDELSKAVDRKRKIVVLSERIKHLEILDEMFKKVKPKSCTTGFYIGGMKQKELDESAKCDVIWSSYQMSAEGLDIPSLDTVFLATPISDVEQSVGRIMREYDDKKNPIITDFIDLGVKTFVGLWNTRRQFYIKEGIYKE